MICSIQFSTSGWFSWVKSCIGSCTRAPACSPRSCRLVSRRRRNKAMYFLTLEFYCWTCSLSQRAILQWCNCSRETSSWFSTRIKLFTAISSQVINDHLSKNNGKVVPEYRMVCFLDTAYICRRHVSVSVVLPFCRIVSWELKIAPLRRLWTYYRQKFLQEILSLLFFSVNVGWVLLHSRYTVAWAASSIHQGLQHSLIGLPWKLNPRNPTG